MIERLTKVYPEDWCGGCVDYSVLMVCVIWTEGLEAHEMQPEPSGKWGEIRMSVAKPVC